MSDTSVSDVEGSMDYIRAHRASEAAFDFVIGGPPRTGSEYAELEEAGVTWYLGGPPMEGEDLAKTLEWVAAGPSAYQSPEPGA
jgi:hypothetical protein